MASPVKDAKDKAQARWPGAIIVERGKGKIKHRHPTDLNRFMLDVQAGGRGWHFGDGPFSSDNEVDTAWIDANPILDAPWQKKIVLADYNAYAFREPTLAFDQGQLIQYVHPKSGETITFQPMQLQWTNDLDQIAVVSDPQNVPASVVDDTLKWVGAYGSGINFRWHCDTAMLQKFVDVESLASLGSPPQYIIDGGHPRLRIQLIFQKSNDVDIYFNGELWNEKNPEDTTDNVEFRLSSTGESLWWFKKARAGDKSIETQFGPLPPNITMRLRKTGPNLFVEILTPWEWLETAVYPVFIDATLDDQVAASADDCYQDDGMADVALTGAAVQYGTEDPGEPDYAVGERYTGITIAQGSTINAGTYVEQQKNGAHWFNVHLNWYCFDIDDCPQFGDSDNLRDTEVWPRTTATIECNQSINRLDDTWYKLPTDGEWQTLVQEVISRGSWSSGNDIGFLALGDTADGWNWSLFSHYDDASAAAPKLHIEYEEGAAPQTVELNALTLASSTPALNVSPGAVGVDLDALTLAGSAPSLAVALGVVSVPLDELTLAGSAEGLSVEAQVSISMAELTLAGSTPTLDVIPGAISVLLDALTLAGSVEPLNVAIDEVIVTMDALTLAGSVESLDVIPGAVSVLLDALVLAGSAGALNVIIDESIAWVWLKLDGDWVDVSKDVLQEEKLSCSYGIRTGGPKDRVAAGGHLDFSLDNGLTNSAGVKGYYTSGGPNVRTGFEEGVEALLILIYDSVIYYKWRGRLTKIKPDAGLYAGLRTVCRAQDWMADAAKLKPEALDVQVDKRGDQLITTALAAVTNQPPATDLSTGKSTFAYSFDEIRDGRTTMHQILRNIALSELGFVTLVGDTTQGGVLTFSNRHDRVLDTDIIIELSDSGSDIFVDMQLIEDEQDVYNIIRMTCYPRVVDDHASDQVLWTLQDTPTIGAGQTVTITGRYTDPSVPGTRIAGYDVISPEIGVDYVFSGADSDLDVSGTVIGGNTVKYIVTNTSGAAGTIDTLQIRGKRVLIYEPALVEASDSDSIADHGDRTLPIRLTYQDKPLEAQDFVDVLLGQWREPKIRAKNVSFCANRSPGLKLATMQGEPGSRLKLTESMGNLEANEYFIQGITLRFRPFNIIDVIWILSNAESTGFYWILGTSELDYETYLGY